MHARLCNGGLNTSIATRGIIMDNDKLDKSLCKEMFAGEIDVTEKPDNEKSQARRITIWVYCKRW